jgi:hypothetical protein
VNIEPDVDCPQCGMVIICPHTPPVPYPPHCINTPPPWPNDSYERTDNFIENSRRLKAAAAREIPDEMWKYFGHTPPGAGKTSHSRPVKIAQPGGNPVYTAAAIRGELDALAATTEGSRNDTLNIAAFSIFGFVKGGHADEALALAELKRVATAIGLSDSEIRTTLRSAWNGAKPREVPAA